LAPDQTEESKELELPGLAVENQGAQMYGFLSDYQEFSWDPENSSKEV
jgi:hypothetical protein